MKARRIAIGVVAVMAVVLGGAYLYARSRTAQLELGVGYAARIGCACRYIGHRALASCYGDFEPGMGVIRLSDDPATRTVTASVPFVASRAARYDTVLGCQPGRFEGTALKVR